MAKETNAQTQYCAFVNSVTATCMQPQFLLFFSGRGTENPVENEKTNERNRLIEEGKKKTKTKHARAPSSTKFAKLLNDECTPGRPPGEETNPASTRERQRFDIANHQESFFASHDIGNLYSNCMNKLNLLF